MNELPVRRPDRLVGRNFRDRAAGKVAELTVAQRRGWEAIRAGGHTLIAAPTGSGETLAAFLHALDALLHGLSHEMRVVTSRR